MLLFASLMTYPRHLLHDTKREHAVKKDAIVVLNSGSVAGNGEAKVFNDEDGARDFNLVWTKPLPDASKMRLNLCCELLTRQRPDLLQKQSSSMNKSSDE